MRKNGFTLIELLAVIVILAIIALIATPIILGIINDARQESQERSVELYASAVRNGIAAYQLTGLNAPKSFSDLTIEYDGDVKCTTEELYEDGSFYLEGCKVNGSEKEYSYGTKQEKKVYLNEVCDPVSVAKPGEYTLGDKYTCTVDPNKPAYTFYVLTTPENGSVNLIMDSNIRTGGEAVKEANPTVEQRGLVAWLNESDYLKLAGYCIEENKNYYAPDEYTCIPTNEYGPITAMNYLYDATKDWKNTNQQIVSTFTACTLGDVECTDEEIAQTFTTNARLPYLSEVLATGCDTNYTYGACPLWMTDHLQANTYYYPNRTAVLGVSGYWTLSSYGNGTAWTVDEYGITYTGSDAIGHSSYVYWEVFFGVRPVINLSI